MKLINIGFGNLVAANRLLAVVSPDSAPIKPSLSKALKKIQGIRGESFSLLSRLRVKDNQRYLSFERALLNNQRSTLLDPLACDDKHKGK